MTPQPQYQLVVRKGPTVGQAIALDLPVMTIGRDPVSDVVLNDPEVSRQHARLTLVEEGYAVQDLGSTNGTFVDGQRIGGEPTALRPGQKLSLGSGVTMIYERADTAGEAGKITMIGDAPTPEPEPAYAPSPPPAPEPKPAYAPPPPAPEPAAAPEKKSNPALIAAIVAVLFLCCCCTFTLFMYQWGGDWLLQYFGLLP